MRAGVAPSVVPFNLDLKKPIKKEEKIQIFIDYNLAYSVWTDSDLGIDFLSGRVRSSRGRLAASVSRIDGRLDEAVVQLRQKGTASVPDAGDSGDQCKELAKSGSMKFMCGNLMGRKAHIGEVAISTSKGNVYISLTPYASRNPFA